MSSKGFEGFEKLMAQMESAASGGLKDEMTEWLEAIGLEFLDVVQDEIIRTETVDTRRLLNSFGKGDGDNVWSVSNGGMTLEVGTNVEYAQWVNDGHFNIDPNSGRDRRWVPGRWSGNRFIYDAGSDEGMLLTIRWIDGSGYWDSANAIFSKFFDKSLEKRLQGWMDKYFG
ncbi:LOW QUALITY PROTEIN: phage-like element PBSX protein XkdI [Geomicrobium sp. JCM 19039]|nr:LOW QUALITY PROTEIN: phage-like element PBSX protein XkdI [Geomicrobium sp. JCM 19039]